MPNELDPIIDQWYQHRDKGELLRIIAVDRSGDVIEIQNFDGDIEEFDFESWHDMDIVLAEEPEDWTGPYDNVEAEDLDTTDTTITPQDWRASLNTVPNGEEPWQDAQPTDEREETEDSRSLESYLSEEDPPKNRVK